ncbi:MAG: Acetyl-CoA acetyltransferase [candidate division Zixibacteria bacterium RBG-1]|nr:MAG: Acetyl-CoA acetyltransferase [candidate division Zixibacteria bacterium RBG-1]OGC84827.1 MAG: beta-ketoadipyl CoA thiolase [candidate division Zixibacteria bacterium RBG_19FT_COMBO_42_43]
MKEIVILDGARTPFGEFCSSLKDVTAIDLGVVASKEAIKRSQVKPDQINHVVFGNALQTSADAIYMARHVGLKSGLPISTPAMTINRLCGSGLQAIVSASQLLLLDEAEFVLAGGGENMSQSPHVIRGARWGFDLGKGQLEDTLWSSLTDPYCGFSMALTAENLAEKFKIPRQEQDEFAYRSQRQAALAWEKSWLKEEIAPVELKKKGESYLVDKDEHMRETTLEGLAKLRPYFRKDGFVTAGNASGICDGASAVVLTTKEKAQKLGLKYLGKILAWDYTGVEPAIMGIGPVYAIKNVLQKVGLKLEQIDLFEINEAFAAQYLAVEKELGLDRNKVNVNGGAIALGHPLAASGARLSLTLLYEMRRRNAKYGVASLCIGGGQGIAAVFERE